MTGYDTTSSNYHFVINWGFTDDPNRAGENYKKFVVEHEVGAFAVIKHGIIEEINPSVNSQRVGSFYSIHGTDETDKIAKVIHIYIDIKNQLKRKIAFSSRQH